MSEFRCTILNRKEPMTNGKMARLVECWCGAVMKLGGLGGHLHHKHKQKRSDVIVK